MTRPVFFALLACLTACGRGTPADPLPRIPFEKYTLANGLDVILAEDHRLPLVAVDVVPRRPGQ
jgi:zinc protease